jgi:hypothetical protein
MSARGSIGGVQRLDFKEKLLEKGKRETGETLLRKVKVSKPFQSSPPLVRCLQDSDTSQTLHQKLSVLEQDQTDTKSLAPVTKPLVDNLILHHKESVASSPPDRATDQQQEEIGKTTCCECSDSFAVGQSRDRAGS